MNIWDCGFVPSDRICSRKSRRIKTVKLCRRITRPIRTASGNLLDAGSLLSGPFSVCPVKPLRIYSLEARWRAIRWAGFYSFADFAVAKRFFEVLHLSKNDYGPGEIEIWSAESWGEIVFGKESMKSPILAEFGSVVKSSNIKLIERIATPQEAL